MIQLIDLFQQYNVKLTCRDGAQQNSGQVERLIRDAFLCPVYYQKQNESQFLHVLLCKKLRMEIF